MIWVADEQHSECEVGQVAEVSMFQRVYCLHQARAGGLQQDVLAVNRGIVVSLGNEYDSAGFWGMAPEFPGI
jgi:hypothetical protein